MSLELEKAVVTKGEGWSVGTKRRVGTILVVLAGMWGVFLVDWLFGLGLGRFGVVPRTMGGLMGIVWMPWLHASFGHLWSNSVGFLMLGGLLMARSEGAFWGVSVAGWLLAGLGTWVIGRGESVHVGMSGVLFAYFGYLVSAGIFERRIGAMLVSVLVFFLWGGMLWAVVPWGTPGAVSWEGHLSGFLAGVLSAWGIAGARRKGLPEAGGSGKLGG